MSIETDESLWPEGAQFYAPETGRHPSAFYKDGPDGWRSMSDTDYAVWCRVSDPEPFRELIPRPTAPWPQVGDKCEFAVLESDNWMRVNIAARNGEWFWLETIRGVFHSFHSDQIKFRQISTLRDELIDVVTKAARVSNATMFVDAVDAILDKYELKEKTK